MRDYLESVIDACFANADSTEDQKVELVRVLMAGEQLSGWLLEHVHGVARPDRTPNGMELVRMKDGWFRDVIAAAALAATNEEASRTVYDEVETHGPMALAVAFPTECFVEVFFGGPNSITVQQPVPAHVLAWVVDALDHLAVEGAFFDRAVRLLRIAFDHGSGEVTHEFVGETVERLSALFDVEVSTPLTTLQSLPMLRRADMPPTTRFFSALFLDGEEFATSSTNWSDLEVSPFGIDCDEHEGLVFRSIGAVLVAGLTSAAPYALSAARRSPELLPGAGVDEAGQARRDSHPAVVAGEAAELVTWLSIDAGVRWILATVYNPEVTRADLMEFCYRLVAKSGPVIERKYAETLRLWQQV